MGGGHIPARVNRLALALLPQPLHLRRRDIRQVITRRRSDDAIPDDSLVRRIHCLSPFRPLRRDVDKHLLRVPCEQAGQVRFEVELDLAVLLLARAVVVWPARDDFDVCAAEDAGRGAGREEVGCCD